MKDIEGYKAMLDRQHIPYTEDIEPSGHVSVVVSNGYHGDFNGSSIHTFDSKTGNLITIGGSDQ